MTETEVNLARKGEGMERFSSSSLSRSIVHGAMNLGRSIDKATSQHFKDYIDRRFEPIPVENNASFDLIRASVNLTISALLISLGTSLKLPLSTTYVTFMVAMGTSLADRAWGRESAVYRINGVLTVVAGWLLTALIAFSASLFVGLFLMWGGKIAIFVTLSLVGFMLFKSGKLHTKRKAKQEKKQLHLSTEEQLVTECTNEVNAVMEKTLDIFKLTIEGLKSENRKMMKTVLADTNSLYEKYKDKRMYEVVPTLETIQINALDLEQEYVQLVDYSYEITKSLKAMVEAGYNYIDNNHTALSREQLDDLRLVYNTLAESYSLFAELIDSNNYTNFQELIGLRQSMTELNVKLTKKQIKRAKDNSTTTRSSILFLNLINESKIIALQSSNLMYSQRNFSEQYSKLATELTTAEIVKNTQLTL